MENVILIKIATELFVDGFVTKWQDFKYLLIKETSGGPIKMLLMVLNRPFEYHAEALMCFMEDKGLSEVIVMGGGKIIFEPAGKEISITGKSYAFGTPSKQELLSFIQETWPSAVLAIFLNTQSLQLKFILRKKFSIKLNTLNQKNPRRSRGFFI